MNPGRTTASILLALLVLALPSLTLAVSGSVVNEERKPIEGARVCFFIDKIELICSLTDAQGYFELPVSETDTIRAHAEGYNPATFSAAAQHGPVTLKRSPVLTVRLTDRATGERIEKGEILVSYPSGKELGPFPANKAGVRIRRGLKPGEIRLVGKAEGFQASDPVAVTLEPGDETVVVIDLVVAEETKRPD